MKVLAGVGAQLAVPAPELVELSPAVVPVGAPRPARRMGLPIAGLATVIFIALAGRQLPADPPAAPAPVPATAPEPSSSTSSSTSSAPPEQPTVAATARILTISGIARAVVSGAASRGVDRVTVSLRLRGRVVGTADAIPGSAGPDHDAFAPWSAVLDVPSEDLPPDAQVTLDIGWSAGGEPLGSMSLILVLGDGRGGGDR